MGGREDLPVGMPFGHSSCVSRLLGQVPAMQSTFDISRLILVNIGQVMESFDMFLSGNFVAQAAFRRRYGVYVGWTIPTRWQSALFQSGQCGALVGVIFAGPVTNGLGYRWTTILALIYMNATIFVSFFVS